MTAPAKKTGPARPVRLLVAAMGGEGGGLLADWIIEAAEASGLIVQATSIPGVAQRTGATTYYLELAPAPEPGGNEPVLGLYPVPGDVDLVIASELVEAGRAIEEGFVTRDRTVLIASSHRVHAIAEKSVPGDGSIDTGPILGAARALAKRTHITDFAALARSHGVALNVLLLGAMAADPQCPIAPEAFASAIRSRGVAVDANLRGFAVGLAALETTTAKPSDPALPRCEFEALSARIASTFPAAVQEIAAAGAQRTATYQDEAYGMLYLDRLEAVLAADKAAGGARRKYDLTGTTARLLALWMSYEDVIRVADLKTAPARARRIRDEVGAGANDLVRVREVLKPGLDELATVLPAPLARGLIRLAGKFDAAGKFNVALHLRSDTLWGYLRLRMVAGLKGLRRGGLRFREEQAAIDQWLAMVREAAAREPRLALELALCAELIKGYSDTRARGLERLQAIGEKIATPALSGTVSPPRAAKAIREIRVAMLGGADETAEALLAAAAEQPRPRRKNTGTRRQPAAAQ